LIDAHAPTEEKDEDQKDLFYATLTDVFAPPTSSIKIVLGDFNAKLGREICDRNVVGNHRLHENKNDNGAKLIDFAVGNGLVIESTMLPKKDIYKYIWVFPGGRYTKKNRSCTSKIQIQKQHIECKNIAWSRHRF